ncbi:hypothetical protein O6H91_08G062300 [Diphasiastrum complanatum]|uniref:Uncharacterized protein n=1 Tax=Diphasiastrum complanatum TaxID=34168 RepID=A0ACC2CYG8_DIPCM|nr:hypothetical protein O6H91_08G062300 [Diphasiastrum complanatum]
MVAGCRWGKHWDAPTGRSAEVGRKPGGEGNLQEEGERAAGRVGTNPQARQQRGVSDLQNEPQAEGTNGTEINASHPTIFSSKSSAEGFRIALSTRQEIACIFSPKMAHRDQSRNSTAQV